MVRTISGPNARAPEGGVQGLRSKGWASLNRGAAAAAAAGGALPKFRPEGGSQGSLEGATYSPAAGHWWVALLSGAGADGRAGGHRQT